MIVEALMVGAFLLGAAQSALRGRRGRRPRKPVAPHPGPPPRGPGWWPWYSAYLASGAWQRVRAAILRRARGVCERCQLRPATQVHHLTYKNVGYEHADELLAVCDDCHQALHRRKL